MDLDLKGATVQHVVEAQGWTAKPSEGDPPILAWVYLYTRRFAAVVLDQGPFRLFNCLPDPEVFASPET